MGTKVERRCGKCNAVMEWELCPNDFCDDGYDETDVLGMRKCYTCNGDGVLYTCPNCWLDDEYEEA